MIFVSHALSGWQVGLKVRRDGTFDVYFSRLLLGRLEAQTASFIPVQRGTHNGAQNPKHLNDLRLALRGGLRSGAKLARLRLATLRSCAPSTAVSRSLNPTKPNTNKQHKSTDVSAMWLKPPVSAMS
jgi:hypothetical protein